MIVFLALASVLICLPLASSEVFTQQDRSVNALEDGQLRLDFRPDLRGKNITVCYFEYINTVQSSSEDFLGYIIADKERRNMTAHQAGWSFIDQSAPCSAGISRTATPASQQGKYRMIVVDDKKDETQSRAISVRLYKEDDLFITVNSGDKHYLKDIRDLPDSTLELPDVKGDEDIETTFSISVCNEVPPETEISVSKTSKDAHGVQKTDLFATCKAQRTCFVRFVLGEESDVVLTATVNTSIQSYPAFGVVQKYNFNGVDKTGGQKAAIAFLVILLLIVALALLYYFWGREYLKERKAKRETAKISQPEDQNLQKEELIQQEDPKLEELSKKKDALNARIVELTKENEAQDNTIKKMQNELHHEQVGHKTQTDRIADMNRHMDELKQANQWLTDENKKLRAEKNVVEEENEIRRNQLQATGRPDFITDPESVTVGNQKEVVIMAKIIGNPTDVVWKKDETTDVNRPTFKALKDKGRRKISHEGDMYKLTITVAPKDIGEYICIAKNKKGEVSRKFSIKK